jgi:MATE family multidrug resistance protein
MLPDKRVIRIEGLIQYFKLGIPSAIMLCLEWWAYETMTIISGLIGVHS